MLRNTFFALYAAQYGVAARSHTIGMLPYRSLSCLHLTRKNALRASGVMQCRGAVTYYRYAPLPLLVLLVSKTKILPWCGSVILCRNSVTYYRYVPLLLLVLLPEKLYRIEETGAVLHGETLMNVGIRVGNLFRKNRDEGCVLHFTAVE